ncbi:hypothetical protein KAFR_0I02730 [Kazachstania africana CBS 2517]|uniref:Vacuolar protein sorting-associated protein 55 n=1 Tax=Kazachstania africana (strain ATCC 22294 / BCRC 22015 / CBS 2517 / CECT 1963 / NBRC 1671 / NRRL Y-8276) TaxID=1071382 RepID=H2B0A2_KAZAF|nr:hypothetical protein KAFR_0I02730 [Kazachstania africana CBS 2517]CCF60052.1 hypothetical protein KAFR_0I02730 [Kazachstania africana CBS 2517]
MKFKVSPLTKIISLSGFLALGFLLVILSCALFHNYYPLFDILLFLVAPLPNSLFGSGSTAYSTSDFMTDSTHAGQDFAHFLTGTFVTSGITLPLILYHCQYITSVSCAMSILGGLIIYSSIVIFSWFFNSNWDGDEDALFN